MKKALLTIMVVILYQALSAQAPLNWIIDEVNPGQDILLFPDEVIKNDGERSCHMQLNSGAVPYLISDNFPVEAGTTYRFSLDVLDNDTLGQLRVYCDFRDALGNNIIGEEPVYSANNDSWTTIQWPGTVPPDAVEGYVLIKFGAEPNMTNFIDTAHIWVDNCSFLEQGGSNLVVNGSYEDWAVGTGEETLEDEVVALFPNPATDHFTVRSSQNIDMIRICDLSGRIVLEKRIDNNSGKVIINDVPPGLYLVKLVEGNTLRGKVKLIKR